MRLADAGPADYFPGGRYPTTVQLAATATGTVLALWTEIKPATVQAARFTPARGWDAPVILASNGTNGLVGPGGVSLDRAGHGLAVWTECCPWVTWAARYDAAGLWGAPELIQPEPSAVGSGGRNGVALLRATLVARDTGEAYALWNQRDMRHEGCYQVCPPSALAAARFTPQAGWEPQEIVIPDSIYANVHSTGFDSEGRLVITAAGSGGYGITVVRRGDGGGWTTPVSLANYPANAPRVSMAPSGAMALLWRDGYAHYENGVTWVTPTIVGSLFKPDIGWSDAAGIVEADVDTRLAFDGSGNGTLVWVQDSVLWSRTLSPQTGWGPAERVTDRAVENANLIVDESGNACVVAWAAPELLLVRRPRGGSWAVPHPLTVSFASNHTLPILVSDSVTATAAWTETLSLEEVSIWAARFRISGQ